MYILDLRPEELGAVVREPDANIRSAIMEMQESGLNLNIMLGLGPYKFQDSAVMMAVVDKGHYMGNPHDLAQYAAVHIGERLGRPVSVLDFIGC